MPTPGADCHLKLDIGGTELGLMLEKRGPDDPAGAGYQYREEEVPSTNTGLLAEASTGDILWPPQVEVPFSQKDWSGGAGFRENNGGGTLGYVDGAWVDDEKITPPPAVITDKAAIDTDNMMPFCYFEDKLYAVFDDRYVYRRDSIGSPSTWTEVLDVGGGGVITDIKVFTGYILVGWVNAADVGQRYYYSATGASAGWTQRSAGTGATTHYFAPMRDYVWGFVNPSTGYSTTDPTNSGTWASATQVGEASYNFVNAISGPDYVMVFKANLGYALYPNGVVQETITEWRDHPDAAHNFKNVVQRGGIIYFVVGPEVYSYNTYQGTILPFGLGELVPYGILRIPGLAADGRQVWVLGVGGPNQSQLTSYMFRCRPIGGRWSCVPVWNISFGSHGQRQHTMVAVTPAAGGYEKDLTWMTQVSAGPSVWDIKRIRYSLNEDITFYNPTFGSGFLVRTGRIDHGRPDLVKQWPYLIVHTQNWHADREIAVYYDVDSSGSYTLLGKTTADGANYMNFPAGTNGHHIELEFRLEAGAQLFGYSLPAHVKLKRRKMFSGRARIADKMIMLNGAESPELGETIRTLLRSARTATGSVKLSDYLDSTDVEVYVLKMEFAPTRHENPQEGEYVAEFVAVEATQGA